MTSLIKIIIWLISIRSDQSVFVFDFLSRWLVIFILVLLFYHRKSPTQRFVCILLSLRSEIICDCKYNGWLINMRIFVEWKTTEKCLRYVCELIFTWWKTHSLFQWYVFAIHVKFFSVWHRVVLQYIVDTSCGQRHVVNSLILYSKKKFWFDEG